ncbi:tRNA lysidine(34) synthetase TilS [Halomonas sp. M20]|uniref:tRNA lysidine(34) synthetase TilS n=1 Tax=Halomonas sp. M20 TaxID=2763264 RepID=UPI001D0BB268|nr:tRNA lysidine(34) synthetase TilS [Halomonas sp. M20]
MPLQTLIDGALGDTPSNQPVWIALSGGLDSCLLLTLAVQAAYRSPRSIYALHVNHGLQPAAIDFEQHCRKLCGCLGVPLFIEQVQVEQGGQGIEAAAREARYKAFARRVRAGESLWLAQHADDQAETLLLAALRGSGVRGLSGMPARREWQGRTVERPLLDCPRSVLEEQAQALEVEWIEDPTNADTAFDRNFLRRRVMPVLVSRWPKAPHLLAQSARLSSEADSLLDELAALDLHGVGDTPHCLQIKPLRELSEPRQRLLVRYACQRLGLSTPPLARLQTLLAQLNVRQDAQMKIEWPGAEARCWQGGLFLQAPVIEPPIDWQCEWDGRAGLMTPVGRVEQSLRPSDEAFGDLLTLTLRRGGEALTVTGRGRRDVKRLLQEAAVPPWQRPQQLLAWHDGTLVAVLGIATAPGWWQTDHTASAS